MVLVLGLIRYLRGPKDAKPLVIFFLGWILGALSLFIKAWLVYRH